MSDVDLLAALSASIERAKQQRRDNEPCPKCGGDRLRADFVNPARCHVPKKDPDHEGPGALCVEDTP